MNIDIETLKNALQNDIGSEILMRRLFRKLEEIERSAQHETSQRITNKLNKLYRGTVKLPEKSQLFLKISDKILTPDQFKLLSLGPKCHFKPKIDPL